MTANGTFGNRVSSSVVDGGEDGHGFFGEVAPLRDLSLVVGVVDGGEDEDDHGGDEPEHGNVVVAPITSTIRRIPTGVAVRPEHEIDQDGVATFDNMAAAPKTLLTTRPGSLGVASAADC